MISEGFANGMTSSPTRENIIEWTRVAMNSMPAQMIQNAWRHGQYSWFSPAPAAAEPAAEANTEEADPAIVDNKVELAQQESECEKSNEDDSTDTELERGVAVE